MSVALPQLDTLEQAEHFRISLREEPPPDAIHIRPLLDTLCQNRSDCLGCSHLAQGIQADTLKLLFLGNERTPSFALCNRGDTPDTQKIMTISYPFQLRVQNSLPVSFGSTRCPREHGEHPPV